MPQSLARLLVHLVFSTKNRIPFLQSAQLRSEVHAYLTATLRGQDCEAVQVGGVSDHVHLLFSLSRTISLAELVRRLKTSSTKMMREKDQGDFSWQTGYGAFSVSESNKSAVIAYIVNQETHHRKMTFQEEIRALLKKHSMRLMSDTFGTETRHSTAPTGRERWLWAFLGLKPQAQPFHPFGV